MQSCFSEQLQPVELQPDRPLTVLIVEDDATLCNALTLSLGHQGFDTIAVQSGRQAIEVARKSRPAVILLDLHLPDADGLDVCQQLVDDAQTCVIPVIVVSGSDKSDILRRCRAAGCHYYLRKPYDPNALLALIRLAIDEARKADDAEFGE